MHCLDINRGRENMLQEAVTRDYEKLLSTTKGVRTAAKFLQETGLLSQFQLGVGLE